MRIEPYDPDARDADNDGIVQEGTAWERPAGTRLVDELGRAITRDFTATNRPRGLRVVDRNGNTVDYTPTYERPGGGFGAGGGTPLAEAGAPSLRERGLPTLRDLTAPRVAPVQPEPTPVGTPETGPVTRIDPEVVDRAEIPYILGRPLAKSEDEAGIVNPKTFNFQPDEAVKRIRKQLKERLEAETDPERKKVIQDFLDRDAEDARGLILRSVDRGMIDAFDAYEDKDVLVTVPDPAVIEILRSGRVKNQLEVGTSSAMYQPQKRIDLEEERFGVPRDTDPTKRPVYGWVRAQERKDGTESEVQKISTDIYGRINLRMKPELKERTTITMGDSAGESRVGVPMLGSSRRQAVSKWLAKDMGDERNREILQFFGRGEDSEQAKWLHGAIGGGGFPGQIQSRVEQRLLEDHPELRGILDDPRDFVGGGFGHYLETQIHGGVDVEDIDAIEVPSDVPDEVRQEIERLAKPYGIRVGTAEELKAAVDSPEQPKAETQGRQPARISGTFAEIFPKWKSEIPEIMKAQRTHESSNSYEHLALREIQRRQGFDGLPGTVPASEWQEFVDSNPDHIPIFRGVAPWGDASASDIVEQFRSGPFFAGNGIYGGGTYTSTDADYVRSYMGNGRGDTSTDGLIEMVIRPDARIIEWGDARDLTDSGSDLDRHINDTDDELSWDLRDVTYDSGRAAAMFGYDAILVRDEDTGEGDFYIVLNRTAVIVKGAEGK